MRRVWLDFARPSPSRHWAGWVLLVLAAAGAAGLIRYQMDVRDRIELTEERTHKLQRGIDRARSLAGASNPALAADMDLTRRLATLGSARWEEFFSAFESVADDTVTLLALHPEGSGVSVTGEAKQLPAATDYLTRLRAYPRFANAYLADYEKAKDHPQRPLRFTIVVPDGEHK